jgi:hypothetical protein
MKTIWIRAENDPEDDDWSHEFVYSATELSLTEKEQDDFIDILTVEIEDELTEFYMVLYFFENYFCDQFVFKTIEEATQAFYEKIASEQDLRNEEEVQVIERSFHGELRSTVYEKDLWGKFTWPDKSTRWILQKVDLSEIE